METMQSLEVRRNAIVAKMQSFRSMCRGVVCEQYYEVHLKGRAEPCRQGPYYVLSRKEHGRTVSRRLKRDEVERARAEVAAYKEFLALCEEFVDLTHRLGIVERQDAGASREKKRPRLRSSKTGR